MVVRIAASASIREYKTLPSGVRGEMQMIRHCLPDTVDPRGQKTKVRATRPVSAPRPPSFACFQPNSAWGDRISDGTASVRRL